MGSIRGGIVADSLGNVSSRLLGGVATSVGAGNIGLAAATGATSRSIGVAAGRTFIVPAFIPKLAGATALIPGPVMGARHPAHSSFPVTFRAGLMGRAPEDCDGKGGG